MAETIQTFFVPKTLGGVRLLGLPLSAALTAAVKKLKIESL